MTQLCNLQNIHLNFGEKVIFSDAKLSIESTDRIGLIGLNGHGKSTLFNILAGKVIPDISNPPFIFDKHNESFSFFYIPQELDIKSFPHLGIENFYLSFYPELDNAHKELNEIQEKLITHYDDSSLIERQQKLIDKIEHLDGWKIEQSYQSYLQYFEIESSTTELVNLSGGELKKVALSIGLSANANLILWDEPTNHLDIETIERFEDELSQCSHAYMIISHDRYLLNHVTNKIVHIEHGKINSFSGTYIQYLEYLEERDKELAKNLDKLQNKHRRELAWMRQGVKARRTRSKKRVEEYHNVKEQIGHLKSLAKKTIDISMSHSGRQAKVLVDIQDGQFQYSEGTPLLRNLQLKVCKKDKIALIGPNGAGKSTLIKVMARELALSSGKLKTLDDLKIVVFDQKRKSLEAEQTLFKYVNDGQEFVHFSNGDSLHVITYLEKFLFHKNQIHRPISTLSGGEKNRLQLAKFLTLAADLWVFDEPTNDLDIETIEILERELSNYQDAVIIIGHDRAFLDNICDKTWVLHDQQIQEFTGGYEQVAPYLHAIELEKKAQNTTQAIEEKLIAKDDKAKEKPIVMTYQEKKRWKAIESEIEEKELLIEELKEKLAGFDFSSHNPEQQKDYEILGNNLTQEEDSLSALYAEWEDLSQKKE